jgi:hypothetical protein
MGMQQPQHPQRRLPTGLRQRTVELQQTMKRVIFSVLSAALATTLFITPALAAEKKAKESKKDSWKQLFDGKDTSQWRGYKATTFPTKGWRVEDGTLRHVSGEGGGDLITVDKFSDFELRFEWKVAPGANSGVIYRVTEDHNASYETGPEYQVLDDSKHGDGKNPKTSAAALYALIACNAEKALKPVGEWNKARIVIKGNQAEHWLNKKKVVEYQWGGSETQKLISESKFKGMPGFAKNASGHICLQDHGDDVWFRNIKIRTF